MKIESLLEEVRKEKRPTAEEAKAVERAAKDFTGKLDRAIRQCHETAKAVIGGSGAKGTWLKGMHDIDVFICFNYSKYRDKSGELSELALKAVQRAFPRHERMHGSRDYFKVQYRRHNFEIVPILDIKSASQARNITDASLLHARWVKKQTSKRPSLYDEIRLTKAFCKAQRVYGAESHIRGFSGYACEILTSYYGSFLNLLKSAKKWKKQMALEKKIIIDIAAHYRGRDPMRELNDAKVQSELIVIDPIQKERNATAALSNETLQRFIEASEELLRKPAKESFEKKTVTIENLLEKNSGKWLTVLEARPRTGKEDVVGAKLVKAFEHLMRVVSEKGFNVLESGWQWDKGQKAILWFAMEKKEPEPEIRPGPPVSNKEHSERFKNEHLGKKGRQLFEKNGKLYAKIERSCKHPGKLITSMVADDVYLLDKARSYEVKNFG